MLDFIIQQLTLFLAAFTANILAALSGGGAGFVQLPVLIVMGLSFQMALGTHKVAVVALGAGSFARNHKLSNLNKWVSMILLFAGCPAVISGSIIVMHVPGWAAEFSLGIITIFSVIYTALQKDFGIYNHEKEVTKKRYLFGIIPVALVGFLSGSFSSGAGLIAILVLVVWFKMDIKTAIHHSMVFVAFIWNFIGAFTIGSYGQICWQWVPMLLIGAFLGGYAGTVIIRKCNTKFIKKLFQTVMLISGILMFWKAWEHYPTAEITVQSSMPIVQEIQISELPARNTNI